MKLALSETRKTGFLMMGPVCCLAKIRQLHLYIKQLHSLSPDNLMAGSIIVIVNHILIALRLLKVRTQMLISLTCCRCSIVYMKSNSWLQTLVVLRQLQ